MTFNFGNANEKQKQAIQITDGPLVIIAGPGTGKTFTLIKRAMYLIQEKGLQPENIMMVTFTEKAAKEIITRLSNELIEKNLNLNVNEMYIGTIHSVCLRILKENLEYSKLKKNYQVFDDFDQQYFLYRNYWNHFSKIENIDLIIEPKGSFWDRVSKLQKYINLISEELVDTTAMINSDKIEAHVIGSILEKYNELRVEENFIDFSSIQTETYKLLLDERNQVLRKLQEKVLYVMVDEYQDTNYIQEQIAFLISNRNNNLCVVGDDDQGLYRFRGATIRNILEFESNFDQCKSIILNDNYRSEEGIIGFYNDFMTVTHGRDFSFNWDQFRIDKRIVAKRDDNGGYDPVIKIEGSSYEELNSGVVDFIKQLKSCGKLANYNQLAFLFRSVKNDKVLRLAKHLEDNGINVYSPRSDLFFDRFEIKLFVGTLLLMFPMVVKDIKENDKKWFGDLYTYYIECMNLSVSELSKEENHSLNTFVKLRARDHLFLPDQDKSVDYSISQLVYQLLQYDLFSRIVTVDLNNGLMNSLQARNVSILIHTIIKYEFSNNINILTPRNINKAVSRLFSEFLLFLYEGGISEYEDDEEYAPSGCVSFLTIHQSKGMEFPVVFVGSLYSKPRQELDDVLCFVEDNFSQRKQFEPRKQIKYFDFWRLYYTAFSRAQNLLVLIGTEESRGISKYFENQFRELSSIIEFDRIRLSSIKESSLKPQYSFTSDVQLYENCQMQYLFFRELGFEQVAYGTTLFGSLVHETIEDIHKAVLRGETQLVNPDSINIWLKINYETISRREKKYLSPRFIETAYKQVLSYYERRQSQWSSIRAAEVPVSIVKEKYILTGKIDLIQGSEDTYEVVDFKTEKKPDLEKDFEKVETARRQLEVYAHILKERFGYKVSKLKIYYTSEENSNPIIEFARNEFSVDQTIKRFETIISEIEKKKYCSKAKDSRICKNCDLRFYCKTN